MWKENGEPKTVLIIGALTGLLAAAMPGIIELVDDSAEQMAVKSDKKTDLAYELIRERVSNIQLRLGILEQRDKTNAELWLGLLKEKQEELDKVKVVNSERGKSAAVVAKERAKLFETNTRKKSNKESIQKMEQTSDSKLESPAQQLPVSLEIELRKKAMK